MASAHGKLVLVLLPAHGESVIHGVAGATDHIVVDLSDEESTHRAVQQIKDRIGPNGELHALVSVRVRAQGSAGNETCQCE